MGNKNWNGRRRTSYIIKMKELGMKNDEGRISSLCGWKRRTTSLHVAGTISPCYLILDTGRDGGVGIGMS